MPKYFYTAKTSPTANIKGEIEADSEQDAINKLTKAGYFPLSLEVSGSAPEKSRLLLLEKISSRQITFFSRQLSSLIDSGVNILNSLSIISNQTSQRYLKLILADILNSIKDGKTLSESLSMHQKAFSSLYAAMVRIGETSGRLNQTLKNLADFLEEEEEFKESLRSALAYPFFVLVIGVITIAVLFLFVIPKLVAMFSDMGQILPLPTRLLISVSAFLRHYWLVILALILLLIFFCRRLSGNQRVRIFLDKEKLKVFFIGPLVVKTEISRLSRVLSLLISSGITITAALDVSSSVMKNETLRAELNKFKEEITSGARFSDTLKKSVFFPEYVHHIVSIGEETGALDKAFLRISEDYEREVARSLKIFTRLLEPIIILVMGLVVAFIVFSMLLPIFQINIAVR